MHESLTFKIDFLNNKKFDFSDWCKKRLPKKLFFWKYENLNWKFYPERNTPASRYPNAM